MQQAIETGLEILVLAKFATVVILECISALVNRQPIELDIIDYE